MITLGKKTIQPSSSAGKAETVCTEFCYWRYPFSKGLCIPLRSPAMHKKETGSQAIELPSGNRKGPPGQSHINCTHTQIGDVAWWGGSRGGGCSQGTHSAGMACRTGDARRLLNIKHFARLWCLSGWAVSVLETVIIKGVERMC